MNRRVVSFPLAVGLTALLAGTVAAVWPPGNVTVDTDGCSFTVNIDLDTTPDIIGWDIRTYADDFLTGEVVLSGSAAPDADGKLTVGPLEAPAGHYNAIVDDETPVDRSSNVVDFTLECSTTSVPSEKPSEKPVSNGGGSGTGGTGQELGAEGGAGADVTPPPTDTTTAQTTSGSLAPMILLILVAAGVVGVAAAMRTSADEPVHVRSTRLRR